MKRTKIQRMVAVIAVAGLPLLTGCGSSSPSNNGGVGGVPGAQFPGVPGGCVPITAQIPFTATNIYFDWANIVGGTIPQSGQSVGQIVVGGSPTGGQYQRSGVDGTISMNIMPSQQVAGSPYPTYPTGTYPIPGQYSTGYGAGYNSKLANAQGFVQISAQTQQDIMYRVQMGQIQIPGYTGGYGYPSGGYGYPYPQPGTQQTQICVSQIAINVGHYYSTIYGGNVYLYLNGTQHGYVLYF
jgi:hypothetical protein